MNANANAQRKRSDDAPDSANDAAWVGSRRRSNVLLAVLLAFVAIAFFFSAILIDFEKMQ